MSVYVLVHGGSVDGNVWNKIKVLLKERGDKVFTPLLLDERSSNLSAHITQVCSVIREKGLSAVVLVGHSYGGMVITGVADRMSERISRMVYIDAAVPDPGQSLFDIFHLAGLNPLSFEGLAPHPPYLEKLNFNPEILAKIPKVYIRCTRSIFVMVLKSIKDKIMPRIKKDKWHYFEIACDHTPMISMPDRMMEII